MFDGDDVGKKEGALVGFLVGCNVNDGLADGKTVGS